MADLRLWTPTVSDGSQAAAGAYQTLTLVTEDLFFQRTDEGAQMQHREVKADRRPGKGGILVAIWEPGIEGLAVWGRRSVSPLPAVRPSISRGTSAGMKTRV